jgi:hypothetical protein
MLRFAQHDKTEDVIPNAVRNPVWMLRFVQHDKTEDVIPHALFCHSERMRGIQYGCFASFSMTRPKMSFRAHARNPVWMLRFAQHDKSGKRGCCTWHDKVGMANLTLWSLSFARRGTFWRKPKQGEVSKQGTVKTERASGMRLFPDSFMK